MEVRFCCEFFNWFGSRIYFTWYSSECRLASWIMWTLDYSLWGHLRNQHNLIGSKKHSIANLFQSLVLDRRYVRSKIAGKIWECCVIVYVHGVWSSMHEMAAYFASVFGLSKSYTHGWFAGKSVGTFMSKGNLFIFSGVLAASYNSGLNSFNSSIAFFILLYCCLSWYKALLSCFLVNTFHALVIVLCLMRSSAHNFKSLGCFLLAESAESWFTTLCVDGLTPVVFLPRVNTFCVWPKEHAVRRNIIPVMYRYWSFRNSTQDLY